MNAKTYHPSNSAAIVFSVRVYYLWFKDISDINLFDTEHNTNYPSSICHHIIPSDVSCSRFPVQSKYIVLQSYIYSISISISIVQNYISLFLFFRFFQSRQYTISNKMTYFFSSFITMSYCSSKRLTDM